MAFKLPKLGKKSKSSKAIYLYPSEKSQHALSETSVFYRDPRNSSWGLKHQKKQLTQQKFNKIHQFFLLLWQIKQNKKTLIKVDESGQITWSRHVTLALSSVQIANLSKKIKKKQLRKGDC